MGDAMTWRPIETAPARREVLLFWPASGYARGRKAPILSQRIAVGHKDGTPNRPPTHWMPLPEPPDAARSTEEGE